MSNEGEIKVSSLEETVRKLENLAQKLENRNLNVVFNNSKGTIVDEMLEVVQTLKETADRIHTVISNTAIVLQQGNDMFAEVEEIATEKIQSIK